MSLRIPTSLAYQWRAFQAAHPRVARWSVKMILAVVSFFSFAIFIGWWGSLVVMAIIAVHENGHVLAMKLQGIKSNGFVFLPFIGGAASWDGEIRWRYDEAFVALAGPSAGLFMAAAFGLLYLVTGVTLLASIAALTAGVNLFNLIPILPLDGGRVLKAIVFSIGSRFGLAFECLLCGALTVFAITGGYILFVAVLFLIFDIIGETSRSAKDSVHERFGFPRKPIGMSLIGGIGTVSHFILISVGLTSIIALSTLVPHLQDGFRLIGL